MAATDELVRLIEKLDTEKGNPAKLEPVLEKLVFLVDNRHLKKVAEEKKIVPKLIDLLKSDNEEVVCLTFDVLIHLASSFYEICVEMERLGRDLFFPMMKSHASLRVRVSTCDFVETLVHARVWDPADPHVKPLPKILMDLLKCGEGKLVALAMQIVRRGQQMALFTKETFEAVGMDAILTAALQQYDKPAVVLGVLDWISNIGKLSLARQVNRQHLRDWTKLPDTELALRAYACLHLLTGNQQTGLAGIEQLKVLLQKRTNKHEDLIEACFRRYFSLFADADLAEHVFNKGSPDSMYRVFEDIVRSSPVFAYVNTALFALSRVFTCPEAQDYALQSDLSDKIMDMYEAGFVDEHYALMYFYMLCVHPNAKSMLPIKRMEQLFTPIIATAKAGTDNPVMAILLLAALVDSDKTRAFSYGDSAVETMKYIVFMVGNNVTREAKQRDNRWKFEIIMAGIANLAVNAFNQKQFGEFGLIPILMDVLRANPTMRWLPSRVLSGLKESKQYALQALMNLAFHAENVPRFSQAKDDKTPSPKEEIVSLLNHSKKELPKLLANPNQNGEDVDTPEDVKQRIKGLESILFILDSHNKKAEPPKEEKPKEVAAATPGAAPTKDQRHIMISYQWAAQQTVIKLAEKLKGMGHKIWLDIEQMQGSTLEAMAGAVEEASLVLICVSQKYKDSPNCRLEGEYAANLRKKVLFLKVQDYQPDGWLGIILGAKLWYNFWDADQFEQSVHAVAGAIAGHINAPPPAPPSASPAPASSPAPAEPHAAPAQSAPASVSVSAQVVPAFQARFVIPDDHACLSWKDEQVAAWLEKYQLSQYAPLFKEHKILGPSIVELIDWRANDLSTLIAYLKELGVKHGDVLLLTSALRQLIK